MKLRVVPVLNLPTKSHETVQLERRHLDIVKDVFKENEKGPVYKDWKEMCQRINKLKLKSWIVEFRNDGVHFKLFQNPYVIPKYEVWIDISFEFTCIFYGWALPLDFPLYKTYRRSVRNITISSLLSELMSFNICEGVVSGSSQSLITHTIPHKHDINLDNNSPYKEKQYFRVRDCLVLSFDHVICYRCKKLCQDTARVKIKINTLAKLNAPLSATNPKRVILALKQERLVTSTLKKQIERMQREITNNGISIDNGLAGDINTIMNDNKENVSPFMKLFWKQQITAQK